MSQLSDKNYRNTSKHCTIKKSQKRTGPKSHLYTYSKIVPKKGQNIESSTKSHQNLLAKELGRDAIADPRTLYQPIVSVFFAVVFVFFAILLQFPNLNSGHFWEGHFPYNHHNHLAGKFPTQANWSFAEWLPACRHSELRCDCRRADT